MPKDPGADDTLFEDDRFDDDDEGRSFGARSTSLSTFLRPTVSLPGEVDAFEEVLGTLAFGFGTSSARDPSSASNSDNKCAMVGP